MYGSLTPNPRYCTAYSRFSNTLQEPITMLPGWLQRCSCLRSMCECVARRRRSVEQDSVCISISGRLKSPSIVVGLCLFRLISRQAVSCCITSAAQMPTSTWSAETDVASNVTSSVYKI